MLKGEINLVGNKQVSQQLPSDATVLLLVAMGLEVLVR